MSEARETESSEGPRGANSRARCERAPARPDPTPVHEGPNERGDRPTLPIPVRVYYEDTDAAGVVYYANYLKFMERARTEWLAAIGFPLAAFEREHGVVFVVHRCEIDFRQPARLNDTLAVTVEVVERGASRLVARQEVRRDDLAAHVGAVSRSPAWTRRAGARCASPRRCAHHLENAA